MSDARSFPETLGRLVADLQSKLNFGPSEDRMVLPRARLIRPGEPVPETFQCSYDALLSGASGQPYTVLIPAYQSYQDAMSRTLVCCLGTNIHVLKEDGGQVRSVCFPAGQISFVEAGRILLYSWIRLHGQDADGAAAFAEFRFNTVTDYILAPIVEWLRSATPTSDERDLAAERAKFDYLHPINIKLANYSWYSITPGERVILNIYQPEIRVEAFRALGFTLFKKRANPHIAILTEKELILIQDGAFKRFGSSVVYGGVWHYVPLGKIVSISVAETADNLLSMSVNLPDNERLDCLFSVSLRPELDRLVSYFEAMPRRQAATAA